MSVPVVTDRPKVQVFGREPAFWIGVIEAALAMLLSWNALPFNGDQIGGIMAVVVAGLGVYTAYVTRDTMLGVLIGLTKALFILGAAFGLHFTENQTASLIALITIVAGGWQRTQTAVSLRPSFRDPSLPAEAIPEPVTPTSGTYPPHG